MNYRVNTSSEETEALFLIVLEYRTVKSSTIRLRDVKFLKMSQYTSVLLISKFSIFEILVCHRHFHYDDVMIIMLYVFSTNSTIGYHLKAFLYMLYIVSY